MINHLYWVISLVCGILLALVLYSDIKSNSGLTVQEKCFRRLISGGIIFSLQDALWGILACYYPENHSLLFASTTLFHMCAVLAAYIWVDYVLVYLGNKVVHPEYYRYVGVFVLALQAVLLMINCFTPVVFYIDAQGQYVTSWGRNVAFINQFFCYLLTAVIAGICYCCNKGEQNRFKAVTMSALAPVITAGFQFFLPSDPFFTIGYTLSCVIAYLYVIAEDRRELADIHHKEQLVEHKRQIVEHKALANVDKLTGIYNRLAYEEAMQDEEAVAKKDFVYATIDLNGLKNINDTYGHGAGDEAIKGAADCLKESIGDFGRLYRIGGDEFAVMLNADKDSLKAIRRKIDETTNNWRGELVKEIALSIGCATREEYPFITVKELAHIADTRMYRDKELYYQHKGIDRRGRSSAVTALSKLYAKILKINLTDDSYQLIRVNEVEKNSAMGFSDKISVWMHDFATSGNVHAADMENYLEKTDIDYLRQHFAQGNKSLTINYHRRYHDEYKPTFMLIITADDYSEDNQSLFLYVCEIFK